jgi:hypothetical protein
VGAVGVPGVAVTTGISSPTYQPCQYKIIVSDERGSEVSKILYYKKL